MSFETPNLDKADFNKHNLDTDINKIHNGPTSEDDEALEESRIEDDSDYHADPFGIPDEPESYVSLEKTRDDEKNFLNDETKDTVENLPQVEKKAYKITERELEYRADSTGQSMLTILLEKKWTWDDVEPSPEDN